MWRTVLAKLRRFRITGISTPFFGLSWSKKEKGQQSEGPEATIELPTAEQTKRIIEERRKGEARKQTVRELRSLIDQETLLRKAPLSMLGCWLPVLILIALFILFLLRIL